QSLHTTVIGPGGEPFEVQIRTWEMHRTAEYGIAAHWRYKEGGRGDSDFDAKLSWLREILEWQSDLKDAREFMESLKLDVFSDEVFVFTPKGDVIELPAGSTPIDFAYRIHTEVGHRCVGAKVNGRIVSLEQPLRNGDIVEILTSTHSAGPSPDWLGIVKTNTARNRIRQFLKRQRRDENLERGRAALEREARAQGLPFDELWRDEWVEEICAQFSFNDPDDLLVTVGYGGLTASQVIRKLREIDRRHRREEPAPADLTKLQRRRPSPRDPAESVRVKGIDNLLVRFSRCCNPVPGDPIIGYVTRGRGVSIHRRDCHNLQHVLRHEGERLIDVTWDNVQAAYYPVHLQINAIDRPGLLSDVAQLVAETRTNILSAKARAMRDRTAVIDLVLEISSLDQLEYLCKRISHVRDVLAVERVQGGEGR
ncbi:MAG TPA: TGS domain-containing protein, partial [Bacillota bacterium]